MSDIRKPNFGHAEQKERALPSPIRYGCRTDVRHWHIRLARYVNEVLVPTLSPGDFVLIDNLGSHEEP